MRKRILVATLVITVLGLVLFSLATTTVSYRTLIENTEAVLTVQVNSTPTPTTPRAPSPSPIRWTECA